jgi:hypothetical protein
MLVLSVRFSGLMTCPRDLWADPPYVGTARPMHQFHRRFCWSLFGGDIFAKAMDAAKRAAEFLHHVIKRALERVASSDQYVVVTGGQCRWRSKADELAQAAPHPVALHGVADLFADRETNPRRAGLGPRPCLQDKGAGMSSRTGPGSLGNGPKVTPAFQPLHCSDFGSDFGMTAF